MSLAVVSDRARVVTIAAKQRGADIGIRVIGGDLPDSAAYRDGVRADLVRLAADGGLEVPMARTYPLERALDAAKFLRGRHPGGKVALLPAHSDLSDRLQTDRTGPAHFAEGTPGEDNEDGLEPGPMTVV